MRAAAPVAVLGSGGPGWRAVQTALPALAAASLAAWGLAHFEQPAWPAWGPALLVGVGAWRATSPQARELRWDGQTWSLDGTAGRPAVALDLGVFLLIRLRTEPPFRDRWWAVTAAEAGAAWPALRAALYSRPPQTTPRGRPPERAAD